MMNAECGTMNGKASKAFFQFIIQRSSFSVQRFLPCPHLTWGGLYTQEIGPRKPRRLTTPSEPKILSPYKQLRQGRGKW